MEDSRFDIFARAVAQPSSRRSALGVFAGGGILAAFGLKRASAIAQREPATSFICVLDFAATVRQGPNATRTIDGELSFAVNRNGNLENAVLRLEDGTSIPVVGQATGHSLQIRFQLATSQTVIALGVGAQEIADCQGAIDGMVTGPAAGDFGDWHAVAVRTESSASAVDVETAAGRTERAPRGSGNRAAGSAGDADTGSRGGGDQKQNAGYDQTATGSTTQTAATPAAANDCGPGGQHGQCATGLTPCNGGCIDLTRDLANCGACGAVCESGLVAVRCANGVCERASSPAACTPIDTDCNGT